MRIQHSAKRDREVTKMLTERILSGEKLTVDGVIKELYNPKTAYLYLLAKSKVDKLFNASLKRKIQLEYGLPFVSLNEKHEWGIPSSEAEARFSITNIYKKVKGMTSSAQKAQTYFQDQKLLPNSRTETISLPVSR